MSDKSPLKPEKRARLLEFLGGLPSGAAAKLFAAIERDRASGGAGLPHDLIIETLRKQLIARDAPFPSRPKTAQRLFFTPFEDFFIAFRAGKKRRARIARASIGPLWRLIQEDPACAGAQRAAAQLSAAIREGSANVRAFEDQMFAAAEEGFDRLLTHAEDDAAFRDDLADRLGGEAGLEDLAEMRLLLSGVEHLRAMQSAFPRPIGALSEEELFEARRIYARARADAPDAAPYLLLALIGRMETPWRALALYYHLAGAEDDAVSKDAGVILEALFDDLEGAARLLERDAAGDLDAEDAARRVSHFADFAEGLAGEARRVHDNVVLNRIEACRDIAAESLARFAEQALAALRRAMPVRHAGGSSKLSALRPDYSRPPGPGATAAAREAAMFLAEADDIARRLGRPGAVDGVYDLAAQEARRYAGDVVVEIRAAEGEDRAAARRLMEQALEFAAPLLPADETALLRERALAAAHSA
ncbi:MAG: hypothetical protein GC153_07440 [Alphaproteobacteria bacterium]|nr:hypothetical protein [Alphaproteobacteria bacterium]